MTGRAGRRTEAGVMERQQLHVETIDTPTWHAVLVIEQRPRLEPDILCIGFKTANERDNWLSFFAPSVRTLAASLPVSSPSVRAGRRRAAREEAGQ